MGIIVQIPILNGHMPENLAQHTGTCWSDVDVDKVF